MIWCHASGVASQALAALLCKHALCSFCFFVWQVALRKDGNLRRDVCTTWFRANLSITWNSKIMFGNDNWDIAQLIVIDWILSPFKNIATNVSPHWLPFSTLELVHMIMFNPHLGYKEETANSKWMEWILLQSIHFSTCFASFVILKYECGTYESFVILKYESGISGEDIWRKYQQIWFGPFE